MELLWSSLKKLNSPTSPATTAPMSPNATEQGIHRINANPTLPWPFLTHTGLTIQPPHPPNLRKDQ
ncbi:transposase [Streptomyces sp. NPDC005931]|uniref:transposase n=1 Tax=Streptomyces sp. NPDC005931 TaxID=3364737 RepID=UPI00368F8563